MSPIRFPDPLRDRYLARIRTNLRNARVPGGDVAAWLAPMPTAGLAEVLTFPRERLAEILFTAMGYVRAASRPEVDPIQDPYAADRTNVAASVYAECCAMAWATVRLAREDIDRGEPWAAQGLLLDLTRRIHTWPTDLARRFEPRIEALYAEADRMRERHLSEEVA